MRDAGVQVLGFKGLYYEWLRTVERADRFGLAQSLDRYPAKTYGRHLQASLS